MSGRLNIRFDSDMPPATVEVVSPDLETVGRVWLDTGGSAELDVPSEGSFLRVHLPTGEIVTLQDPGNLNRLITLGGLVEQTQRRVRSSSIPQRGNVTALKQLDRSLDRMGAAPGDEFGRSITTREMSLKPTIAGFIEMELIDPQGKALMGAKGVGEELVSYSCNYMEPVELRIKTPDQQLIVRLPGTLKSITVNSVPLDKGEQIVRVRVRTANQKADTLGSYVARGDINSAAAMTSWADKAEEMLYGKMDDPFAATLGAYLLLRLRKFDLMRGWAKNLADRFKTLTDGKVIWAWQQIYQKGSEGEIRDYLGQAAFGPLPVFTQGLKLLGDGLRLLAKDRPDLQEHYNESVGIVLWESPFTASFRGTRSEGNRVRFDVGYEA
jgi:hypothetical protein